MEVNFSLEKQGYSIIISQDGVIDYISPSLLNLLGFKEEKNVSGKELREKIFPLYVMIDAYKKQFNKGFFLCALYSQMGIVIVKGSIQKQKILAPAKTEEGTFLIVVEPVSEEQAVQFVLEHLPKELIWKTGEEFWEEVRKYLMGIFHLNLLTVYHYSQSNFVAIEENVIRDFPEQFCLTPELVNDFIGERKFYLTPLLEEANKSLSNYFLFPLFDKEGELKYALLAGTDSFWMLADIFKEVIKRLNARFCEAMSRGFKFIEQSPFIQLIGIGNIKKLDKMVTSLNLQSLDISNVLVPFKEKGKSKRMYLSINVHNATSEIISLSSVISGSESTGEHKMVIDRNILKLKEDLEYYKLFYDLLFENSMEAVFIYDMQGRFVQANQTALKMIGAPKDVNLSGHSIEELLPEEEMNKLRELMGKRLFSPQHAKIGAREMEVQTLNGERKYMESWGMPFYRNGEVYFIGIARDITEKVRMRKRLELLLNSVDEIIILAKEDETIEYINHRVTQLLGYPKEFFIGKKLSEFGNILLKDKAQGEAIVEPFDKKKQPLIFSYKVNEVATEIPSKKHFLISLFNISQQKLLSRLLDYFFVHAPLGLLLIDNASGRILKYNQAGLDILEIPEEELLRYPVPVLIQSGAFLPLQGKEEWKGVLEIGEKKVKVYRKSLYIPMQSAGITIVILEDITKEEKQAEQLRTIGFAVSSIPEGILVAKQKTPQDTRWKILYQNNKARKFWSFFDKNYEENFYEILMQCVKNKENRKKLEERVKKSKAFVITEIFIWNKYYALSVYPLKEVNSLETTWVVIIRNINAQVEYNKLKEKLKQQEFALKLTKLLDREESKAKRLIELLHDNIATPLSTITWTLDAVIENVNKCEATTQETKEQTSSTLRDILKHINSIVNLTRSVSHELKFDALADLGLIEAVSGLCKLLSRNNKKIGRELNIVFDALGNTELQIQEPLKLNIFRIVQELLNNIIKHSTANEVFLTMEFNSKTGTGSQNFLQIYLEENGQGFDIEEAKRQGGIGLTNIEEKVRAFGGSINWGHNGTYIEINIPLPDELVQ